MIMKFIVNQTVFTEKQKGNQFFTMDTYIVVILFPNWHSKKCLSRQPLH